MVFKLNRINKNFISAIFQDKPETLNSIQIVSHNFQSVLIHRFSIQLINLIFMNRTEPFFILRFPIIKNLSEVFLLIFHIFFTFRLLKPYFLNLCFPFVVLLSNLGISLYVKISGTRFFAPRFFLFCGFGNVD